MAEILGETQIKSFLRMTLNSRGLSEIKNLKVDRETPCGSFVNKDPNLKALKNIQEVQLGQFNVKENMKACKSKNIIIRTKCRPLPSCQQNRRKFATNKTDEVFFLSIINSEFIHLIRNILKSSQKNGYRI